MNLPKPIELSASLGITKEKPVRLRGQVFPNIYRLHLSDFDFNIYSTWKFDFHQCVNSFGAIAIDIHQSFVSTKLVLISCFFVNVRGFQNSEFFLFSWQRNWPNNDGSGCFHRFHDLL
jgi:hypothetical protein